MMFSLKKMRPWIGVLLFGTAWLPGNYAPQTQSVASLPETLSVRSGEFYELSVGWPYTLTAPEEAQQVLSSSDELLGVIGGTEESTKLTVSLLGIPVKTIDLQVQEERILYPGGENIGAALNTSGVLVVGISGLSQEDSPARAAGLRAGDVILAVNGEKAQSAAHLSELIARNGENACANPV